MSFRKIIIATLFAGIFSVKPLMAASYTESKDKTPSTILLNRVDVVDEDGKASTINATLVAVDLLQLHGGQIYQLKGTGAPTSNDVDASFSGKEAKLIVPIVTQSDIISYNLTLIKTNGDKNGNWEFTVSALSMTSHKPGSDVKVVFIQGPKGDKGDKCDAAGTTPITPVTPPPITLPVEIGYKLGDKGPSGGIIFYLEGNKLHGLEAQPKDFTPREGLAWEDAVQAATLAGAGWRLPNKNELNLLYINRAVVGEASFKYNDFDFRTYWSSQEYDSGTAWYEYFGNGTQRNLVKTYKTSGRSIKSF